MNQQPQKDVLRKTDEEARTLARRLLREARAASLATLEPETGHPLASRATMATMMDASPILLLSDLSSHTAALRKDARCSLLIGESGKGDPLAYARMTVLCTAKALERGSKAHGRARTRFLNRHPKAALYIDFGDFHLFQLAIERISLNGGFGKAYALDAGDVMLLNHSGLDDFYEIEAGVLQHMNDDHSAALAHYGSAIGGEKDKNWKICGIDPAGIDLMSGEHSLRVAFADILKTTQDIRPMLVSMAKSE